MQFLFMKLPSHSSSNLSSSSIIIFLSFYVSLLFWTSEAVINLPENVTFPALIVFGDSIVDQGNNNNLKTLVKCNFAPYGKEFMGGNPTGRFSNGKTPADLIAEELGIKELVPAYLDPNLQTKDLPTGISFASGATGYDPQTPELVSVLSLSDQLEMFKEYIEKLKGIVGEEGTQNILANSLFLVVAGSDDIANTYFIIGVRKLQYDIDSYTDLMVSSASSFIQELYKLGARRIGVIGGPPLGCLPSQRTLAGGVTRVCSEKHNQAAQLFNKKLSPELDSLKNNLAQSRVVYLDIYNPLLDLIENPKKYGFDVVEKGCCGTGNLEVSILCNKVSQTCPDDSIYLFWDSYHPTEKCYRVIVDMILQKSISSFF
uniref:Putative GDSL esterase/lipase EXL3-like n=1 Tax=Davidia involucrata TaxID=16924 RepID=A0A5B7B773_DAVIN